MMKLVEHTYAVKKKIAMNMLKERKCITCKHRGYFVDDQVRIMCHRKLVMPREKVCEHWEEI